MAKKSTSKARRQVMDKVFGGKKPKSKRGKRTKKLNTYRY